MAGIETMLLDSLNASAQAGNAAGAERTQLSNILQQMGVLNTGNAAAVDAKTAGTNVVEGQMLSGAQAAQDATRTFARAAGSDITSPEQILVGLGEELRANLQTAKQAQASIQAKESARIIDDPLGWLKGQLTIKQDYQAYNQAAEKANLASQSISSLTRATDEVGRTQDGLAVKITDASRAAAAEVRIAEGTAAKMAAERGHLKDEMVISSAIQNTAAAQAQEAQRQLGMVMTQAQFQLEQERMAMTREQYSWERAQKTLANKKATDAEATKQQLLRQYNIGANALGLPGENNFDLLMARAELGGTDKVRISAAMEAGGNSLAAGSTRVSASPAGATSMLLKGVYPQGNDPAFSSMKKYLKDTWDNTPAADGKEATKVANMNAQVKADVERYSKNAVATGSFYAPPPLANIVATRSVQASPLYQKVLATAGKDLTTAAPTPIVKLAFAAVESGTLTLDQAARGLNEFFGQAVNINNTTKRFAQIGVPAQIGFNVKPDIYGTDIKADLTDYSSTLRLFATMKSREVFKQIQGGGLNLPAAL